MTIDQSSLPEIRGKYLFDAPLSSVTWFRVGGPADVIFMPADVEDLAHFLKEVDKEIPIQTIGVGSNLLVRDGGVRGVVIRLAGSFSKIEIEGDVVHAGAAALDANVAKKAAQAGLAGLEFYRGIPGTIGGALRMNAGAYGRETCDVLIDATAVDRDGNIITLSNDDMGFSYRNAKASKELIFVSARYKGTDGNPEEIEKRMAEIMSKREASQPIKERTGGSTFKNPDQTQSKGLSSWQLVDGVGGRGRVVGGAQVSEQHCNFLINRGDATAADLENLGESIRADVLEKYGVELRWEIRRIGEPKP